MKLIRYTLCLLAILNGTVFAHTALKESVPAEGSLLNASPEHIQLSFTEEVRLLRLDVVTALESAEKKVDIGFAPESAAKAEYSLPLPAMVYASAFDNVDTRTRRKDIIQQVQFT